MTPLLGICTDVKASGAVTVRIGSQIISALCPRDLTVGAGDTVTLTKVGSSFYVLQRYYSAAGGSVRTDYSDAPESAPDYRSGTTTFLPVSTQSWSDTIGWRTDGDEIYQGRFDSFGNHIGCAFYGDQISSLVGATVTDAWIAARRLSDGAFSAQQTTIGSITESSKPAGEPTFSNGETGPKLSVGSTATNIVISNSLAQSLVDGTYGGLGIYVSTGSPYVRLAGLAEYGASFALTITWEKYS